MKYSVFLFITCNRIYKCSHRITTQQAQKSFSRQGLANDTAKLESLDLELLQAAIFHATNLERSKKRQFKYGKEPRKRRFFSFDRNGESRDFLATTNRKNKKYKTPFDRAEKV